MLVPPGGWLPPGGTKLLCLDEISVFLSYVRFHSIPELRETRHSRKAKPPFFERDEAAAADDQVVQHFAI